MNDSLMPHETKRLLAEGYSRTEIEKIWGINALRVLHDGWGK